MKKIKLTRGKFAIVDDEDFEYLSQWKWCFKPIKNSDGYALRRNILKNNIGNILMHRLIKNPDDNKYIDHVNGNGLDNRKSNLRECSSQQNNWNSRKKKNNSLSKYKGVTWCSTKEKWRPRIRFNNKLISLGRYDSEIDAAKAYNAAAMKYFGEFAYLNEVAHG